MLNTPDRSLVVAERLRQVAHEMRTPLNAVIGFAQLLRNGVASDRRDDAHLRNIETAARHLAAMVADLIDLPDLELGKVSLKMQRIALEQLAREALCIIQPSAAESGVKIDLVVHDAGLAAIGDRRRVLQVLLNLLSNAIKYGRGIAGQVELVLGASADGSSVRLSVQDAGPGLTEEQASRLFRPFERLGAERTPAEGSGLGLYIARGIAQAMGGSLELASRLGHGSEFTLVLPRDAGNSAGAVP